MTDKRSSENAPERSEANCVGAVNRATRLREVTTTNAARSPAGIVFLETKHSNRMSFTSRYQGTNGVHGTARPRSLMLVVSLLLPTIAFGEPRPVTNVSDATEKVAGFVPMFDGKTLDGWSVSTPTAAKDWYVRDGCIVGEGDSVGEGDGGRSYLIYDKNRDIADFEMKFAYRFPGQGNSGVNVRARTDPTGKRDYQAYHVDLGHVGIGPQVLGAWDFHTPGRREHRCFRGERLVIDQADNPTLSKIADAVAVKDIHQHQWNNVHVIVKGNRHWFSINEKPSSEFIEHLPKAKRLRSGMIQLQLHDPGMIVEFRELWIKVTDRPHAVDR